MYSVEQSCRLCLTNEENMESIFTSNDTDLPTKIQLCTSIVVKNNTGLPTKLCEECKSSLVIWMKFRRMCLRTNETLKANYPLCFEDPSHTALQHQENSARYKAEYETITFTTEEEVIREQAEKGVLNDVETELINEDSIYKIDEIEYTFEQDDEQYVDIDRQQNGETMIEMEIVTNPQADEEGGVHTVERKGTKRSRSNGQVTKVLFPDNRVRYVVKCEICGKNQQNLKQHMRVHLDEKPFKCPYCDRSFRQRGNFSRHTNIHTGRKPYKCKECDAAFADPASLRAHKVRHTGAREYPCDVCGKAFSHSHVLAAHKRIHTQDRRHPCSYCEKRFLSSHALRKHVRTHTGERPFKCELCPKSFATSGNLRTHQKVHTKIKPFQCRICQSSFAYLCVLKTHMRRHLKDSASGEDGKEEVKLISKATNIFNIVKSETGKVPSECDDTVDEEYEIYVGEVSDGET